MRLPPFRPSPTHNHSRRVSHSSLDDCSCCCFLLKGRVTYLSFISWLHPICTLVEKLSKLQLQPHLNALSLISSCTTQVLREIYYSFHHSNTTVSQDEATTGTDRSHVSPSVLDNQVRHVPSFVVVCHVQLRATLVYFPMCPLQDQVLPDVYIQGAEVDGLVACLWYV